jgi:ubiquinone biosynthesis protein UbiJ
MYTGKMSLKENFLRALEGILNRLLDDQSSSQSLEQITGKCIHLLVSDIEFAVFLTVAGREINLLTEYDGEPDVKISGTASEIFTYLLSTRNKDSKIRSRLEISGDITLAQDFQGIMKNLDIDMEEYLSIYTGDFAAHKIGNILKSTSDYLKYASRKIKQDINEYLVFEKNVVISESEINEFLNEVDILRDDVERLKVRVDKLTNDI